jgi:hypothetical protein
MGDPVRFVLTLDLQLQRQTCLLAEVTQHTDGPTTTTSVGSRGVWPLHITDRRHTA